jgi:hypothetical protein
MFSFSSTGSFKNTEAYLKKMTDGSLYRNLSRYGKMGVDALADATPEDTGLAADSWGYRVIRDKSNPGIEWYNTDIEGGKQVAILIQYGHGTRNGGYVQGRDYINPGIRPVFDKIVSDIWRQVQS